MAKAAGSSIVEGEVRAETARDSRRQVPILRMLIRQMLTRQMLTHWMLIRRILIRQMLTRQMLIHPRALGRPPERGTESPTSPVVGLASGNTLESVRINSVQTELWPGALHFRAVALRWEWRRGARKDRRGAEVQQAGGVPKSGRGDDLKLVSASICQILNRRDCQIVVRR